ncbi:MAG: branched-chain amino acid ABC transporter permease [Chloroflexota bacterium]|nr:MAG: branched-chain amino acid ABC transporter permease [Chloroflexota bacterium]
MDIVGLLITGIIVGTIYGLIAMGFSLVYKASGVFNMAQGEIVLISAFVLWTTLTTLHLPAIVAAILTIVAVSIFGIVVERTMIRPLIGQDHMASVMMTLSLVLIIKGAVAGIWATERVGFPEIFPKAAVKVSTLSFSQSMLWSFVIAMLILLGFTVFFNRTKAGLEMRAVAMSHAMALSLGIDVKRLMTLAWVFGAGLGAVGGILLASIVGVSMGIADMGLKALSVVLLAGMQSLQGCIVAGMIVGLGEILAVRYLDPYTGGGMGDLFPFVLMLALLLMRPYGLFGEKIIDRV